MDVDKALALIKVLSFERLELNELIDQEFDDMMKYYENS